MRNALVCLVVVLSAGGGCMSVPSWWQRAKSAPLADSVAQSARPRAAVSADQITDGNAREMAGVLLDELDRDAQAQSLAAVDETASVTKTADDKKR
jgi:hypothetical protein